MRFCEFDTYIKEGITDALKYTFDIKDITSLERHYSFFGSCFADLYANVGYQTPYLFRCDIQPKTADDEFILKYNSSQYNLGIDLPIYLTCGSNKKNVVIIAEDPLRNSNDEFLKPVLQHAMLSTPFATHLDSCRKSLKEYWDFHQTLIYQGYNVYITDLNKIWLKKENAVKESIPNDLALNFKATLQTEIDLVKADLVITYGNKAANALQRMELNLNAKVLNFIHPSRTANGSWKKLFINQYPGENKNCSSTNKVEYMIDKLNSFNS